jgi:uncharacterized protein YdeI (YjbR/CyaY-like superfamily)
MTPTFFRTPADFRKWLARHHATVTELFVGYYKKHTGRPSLTWEESVDEALCFGWIDGIRRSLDADRYTNRFTPRRPGSHWSAVNIRRAEALIAEGRMQPAGRVAFDARRPASPGEYSYEQRSAELVEPYASVLKRDSAAWAGYQALSPSRRKAVNWWILSAKQDATRLARLEKLRTYAARGELIPELAIGKAPAASGRAATASARRPSTAGSPRPSGSASRRSGTRSTGRTRR